VADSRVNARKAFKALRKNVLAKRYCGKSPANASSPRSRKRAKRMKSVGSVNIPQAEVMAVLD
jgi:translation elongation factor EF-4